MLDNDPYAQSSFTVTNGKNLKDQVAFLVRSIIIDNHTSSYYFHPDSGRYVAPGQGASFSCIGTHQVRLLWQAPPGKNQTPAVATEAAIVTVYASPTPPGSGIAAPSNQTLPWITPSKVAVIDAPATGTVIIGGVVGQTVYLHTVLGGLDAAIAAGWWRLLETSASAILCEFASASINPQPLDFKGLPLPVGAGLKINLSGAQVVRGTVTFSQA